MTEGGSEQFTTRGRPGTTVEDSPDYVDDDLAEIDTEDFGEPDDPATVQDQGDSGTADAPQEPGEAS